MGRRSSTDNEPKNSSPNPMVSTQSYMGELAREYRADMVAKTRRKRKQPYKRTEKIEQALWTRICCGESLNDICKATDMPAYSTVAKWMAEDPEFERYLDQAYLYQGRQFADILKALADGSDSGMTVEERKLKAKIYIWLAEKYNRKLFGQQVQLDVKSEGPAINLPSEFGGGVLQGQIIDKT